jgi:hypothetical protein
MNKLENWTVEFSEFIQENKNREFKRSMFDCTIFVGLAIEVITGVNLVEDYLGQYKTKKEGFELLKSQGINDLCDLVTEHLDQPYSGVGFAQRGDVVLIEYHGETALGVVDLTGRRVVTTGKEGLVFLKMEHWLKAWKV